MSRRASLWLLTGALFALVPAARADVVHLTNGRAIRGRVVEDGEAEVVVRTVDGRVVLPRRLVERIERESAARRLLGQAREAARVGDRDAALELYAQAAEEAADAGEARLARTAEEEREELARRPEPEPEPPEPARETGGRWDGRGDPFATEEREAWIRELEREVDEHPELAPRLVGRLFERGRRRHGEDACRGAVGDFRKAARYARDEDRATLRRHEQRCRLEVASRAVRSDDARLARRAVEAVIDDPASDRFTREAHFLRGRSSELLRDRREARRSFQAALEGTPVPEKRELAVLRELARLRAAGIEITPRTPGVAPGWTWSRTQHFGVLHELAEPPPDLERTFESAYDAVVDRLDLGGDLDERGRIAVFLFAGEAGYRASAGARSWSAGHARRLRTDRALIRSVYLLDGRGLVARLRHEVAHILVGDALDDARIPAWANEGAAIYTETEAVRARRRAQAAALAARDALRPVPEALARMLPPLTEDRGDAAAFYAHSAVLFEELAGAVGVGSALDCLTRFNEEGPDAALRSVGLRVPTLEDRVERALQDAD